MTYEENRKALIEAGESVVRQIDALPAAPDSLTRDARRLRELGLDAAEAAIAERDRFKASA